MTNKNAIKRTNIVFANSGIEVFDIQNCQSTDTIFAKIRLSGTFSKGFQIELYIAAGASNVNLISLKNEKIKVGAFKKVSKNSDLLTFKRTTLFWETLSKMLLQ